MIEKNFLIESFKNMRKSQKKGVYRFNIKRNDG